MFSVGPHQCRCWPFTLVCLGPHFVCLQERPYPKAPCDMTTYPSTYGSHNSSHNSSQQQRQQQQRSSRAGDAQRGGAGVLGGSERGIQGNGGLDSRKRPRGSVGYGGCGEEGDGDRHGRVLAAARDAEVHRRYDMAFGDGELAGRWQLSP